MTPTTENKDRPENGADFGANSVPTGADFSSFCVRRESLDPRPECAQRSRPSHDVIISVLFPRRMRSMDRPARLDRILETVLYCRDEDREAMRRFYDDVLGLAECRIGQGAYRLESSLLLLFNADASTKQASPPPHGTKGRGHTCFVSPEGAYEDWKDWIRRSGAEVLEEIDWTSPFVGRSFYFHDLAGNVVEIAERDIWPVKGDGDRGGMA